MAYLAETKCAGHERQNRIGNPVTIKIPGCGCGSDSALELRGELALLNTASRFWLVTDPGAGSPVLADVMRETTLSGMANEILGGLLVVDDHAAIYNSHTAALRDAKARIAQARRTK